MVRRTVTSQQPRRNTVPADGSFRVRLKIARDGRWLAVGPFRTRTGACLFASDLLTDAPGVGRALRIEYRNRGAWKPARAWAVA